jgi:competence protein ComEA
VEDLSRPAGPETWTDRARAWTEWFGVGRLAATVVAVVVVVAGGVWLVRSPPPPIEASLPVATTAPDPSPQAGLTPPATVPSVVLVHVAGSVIEPGVYELPPGARVRDAVAAAGGPTTDANWGALNLAAPVADGTRIYVPMVGEVLPPEMIAPAPAGAAASGPVDVNRASAEELQSLPGVGPATAAAIVAERERNGPFVGVDDLDRVRGIGPAKLEALRGLVTT